MEACLAARTPPAAFFPEDDRFSGFLGGFSLFLPSGRLPAAFFSLPARQKLPRGPFQGMGSVFTEKSGEILAAQRLSMGAQALCIRAQRLCMEAQRLSIGAQALCMRAQRLSMRAQVLCIRAQRLSIRAQVLGVRAQALCIRARALCSGDPRRCAPGTPASRRPLPGF